MGPNREERRRRTPVFLLWRKTQSSEPKGSCEIKYKAPVRVGVEGGAYGAAAASAVRRAIRARMPRPQRSACSCLRARCSRDVTVATGTPVSSAISRYLSPSMQAYWRTTREFRGNDARAAAISSSNSAPTPRTRPRVCHRHVPAADGELRIGQLVGELLKGRA